jgi:hypothetical protein
MPRGPKKHLKRLNAPKHWMLDKLGGIFVRALLCGAALECVWSCEPCKLCQAELGACPGSRHSPHQALLRVVRSRAYRQAPHAQSSAWPVADVIDRCHSPAAVGCAHACACDSAMPDGDCAKAARCQPAARPAKLLPSTRCLALFAPGAGASAIGAERVRSRAPPVRRRQSPRPGRTSSASACR